MSEGVKHDSDKTRYDLLPMDAVERVAEVLTFGAKKYAPNNWKNVEEPERRYIAAAMRHISAHMQDEVLDNESGLSHLAHATTCLMFLLSGQSDKELSDYDRLIGRINRNSQAVTITAHDLGAQGYCIPYCVSCDAIAFHEMIEGVLVFKCPKCRQQIEP